MNYNYYRNSSNLFTPEEGYNLGNMFTDLYQGYKNYQPAILTGKTEKEKSFLELSRIGFAMHEMNLYLDLHPEDKTIQKLFNDYRKMYLELEQRYEQSYGPITVTSNTLDKTPFAWVKDEWPWEGGANV